MPHIHCYLIDATPALNLHYLNAPYPLLYHWCHSHSQPAAISAVAPTMGWANTKHAMASRAPCVKHRNICQRSLLGAGRGEEDNRDGFDPNRDINHWNIYHLGHLSNARLRKIFAPFYRSDDLTSCGPTTLTFVLQHFATDGPSMYRQPFHGRYLLMENEPNGLVDINNLSAFLAQIGYILCPSNSCFVGGEPLSVGGRTLQPGQPIYSMYNRVANELERFINKIVESGAPAFLLLFFDVHSEVSNGRAVLKDHHVPVLRRGPS